jgi:ketosteroid isomerase-like protein
MSEQNVATVRAIFDALNGGDLDEALAHLPEDFVLDWSEANSPESGVYRSREQIRAVFERFTEPWSDFEWFESEIIDAGDLVVRVGGIRGRGEGSGLEVRARGATVWTFRGGKPRSLRLFQSKEEALEAIGHPE